MKKILVIGNEHAQLCAPSLSGAGYDVATATSGWQALEQISDPAPNLFLIDVALPVLNGFELTRRIRALPSCRHCRVVLVGTVPAGASGEWDAVLPAPPDLAKLLAVVKKLIG